jgi:hypothetical protein
MTQAKIFLLRHTAVTADDNRCCYGILDLPLAAPSWTPALPTSWASFLWRLA